jgi:hypothetical protein
MSFNISDVKSNEQLKFVDDGKGRPAIRVLPSVFPEFNLPVFDTKEFVWNSDDLPNIITFKKEGVVVATLTYFWTGERLDKIEKT